MLLILQLFVRLRRFRYWAVVLMLLHSSSVEARQAPDFITAPLPKLCERGIDWFSRDKACHFLFSAAGTAGIYAISRAFGAARIYASAGSVFVVWIAGLLRETFAFDEPNELFTWDHFSRRDLAWNLAGILVGLAITDRLFLLRARRRQFQPE